MLRLVFLISLIQFSFADDPIVHQFANCPSTVSGAPSLHLTADVPAYASARCRNGDKELQPMGQVKFGLRGTFDQNYVGSDCQFYKKDGSNTFTVDVEFGWGEKDTQIIEQKKIRTISCSYDANGRAISSTQTIGEWFLNPWEAQTLLGGNSSAIFSLKVIDVLGREIDSDRIAIGRKVRLMAVDTTGTLQGFRALSCWAKSSVARYSILRAGCGDGLVFSKEAGFVTDGARVFSPYFDAFKLHGGDNTLKFMCRFTECLGPCNGDSCSVEVRRAKRSLTNLLDPQTKNVVISNTRTFKTDSASD